MYFELTEEQQMIVDTRRPSRMNGGMGLMDELLLEPF